MSNMTLEVIGLVEGRKKEEVQPTFFLDSFPKQVLDNVLRFFSKMPNANSWETHIDLLHLVQLLAVRGELGIYIKSRFNTLCVSNTKHLCDESASLGWKEKNGPHLWTNSIDVAHKYILAGGGEYLKTLVVSIEIHELKKEGEHLIDDFRTHCPNVKSLSIAENDSAWVNAFGKQLETIEFSTTILTHPPQCSITLREFTLNTYVECEFPKDLWQKIGSGLEKLVLYGISIEPSEVARIEQYCRNLKSISLEGDSDESDDHIANLLISYGDQLEYALLINMTQTELKSVAKECPNAFLELETDGLNLSIAGLQTFGPKLESLSIIDFTISGDVVEWKYAWDKCVNMRKLSIINCKISDVEIILSTPKQQLKRLDLSFDFDNPEDVKTALDVCAKGTECVEKLIYSGPALNGDTAKLFFEKNRASLSVISLKGASHETDEELKGLLNLLMELPKLEVVHLKCMPGDFLKALETRGVLWKRDPCDYDT